jgi:uncharacterized protein (DUF58 family)
MRAAAASQPALARAMLADLVRLRGKATGFSFLPRQPVHSILTGRHASRLRGRGLNFEELRHYVQGDDTRTIDWAATARLRSPHVRVFTEERDRPVLLVVDQRLSMFFGSRRAMKSVAAAEAAALAAWRTISVGDRIGAIVFSDTAISEFRPQGRSPSVMRILDEIVRQNGALDVAGDKPGNPGAFNAALGRALRLVTHDWLVCIVSDMDGADPESVRLVTQMTAHNDVLAVFIYDPVEAALPNIGPAVIGQAGMQLEVNTAARRLRHGYARDFADRRARIEQLSRERAIAVLPIATDTPVEDQLRAALGERLAASAASAALGR